MHHLRAAREQVRVTIPAATTWAPVCSSVLRAHVFSTPAPCGIVMTMRCRTELRRHRRSVLLKLRDCSTDHSLLFRPPRVCTNLRSMPCSPSAAPDPRRSSDRTCTAPEPRDCRPEHSSLFWFLIVCSEPRAIFAIRTHPHGMGSSVVFSQYVVSFKKGVSFAEAIECFARWSPAQASTIVRQPPSLLARINAWSDTTSSRPSFSGHAGIAAAAAHAG